MVFVHYLFALFPRLPMTLEYDYVQEFGEGIDRMFKERAAAGLPAPEYHDNAFMLNATIRNGVTNETDGVIKLSMSALIKVERVAHDGKRDSPFFEQSQQPPEIRVQDRIAASEIEIRQTAVHFAKVQTVIEGVLHLRPAHGIQLFTSIAGKDIAVPAPLVALIRNMPLKRKILLHRQSSLYIKPAELKSQIPRSKLQGIT